jgi:YD repeat-containing protein
VPKTDLQSWDLIGPVRTISRESAEWDQAGQTWGSSRYRNEGTFRADGRLEETRFYNPDGSIVHTAWLYEASGRLIEVQSWTNDGPKTRTRHSYDASGRLATIIEIAADGTQFEITRYAHDGAGRKTKVEFLRSIPNVETAVAVEGSEQFHGVPGAATATTTYDDHDRPSEVQMHDASHTLIHTIVITRDREGRVLTEENRYLGAVPFGPSFEEKLKIGSDEDRAKLAALLAVAFPDQTFTRTSYEYDQDGRKLSVTRGMGAMGGSRTTFFYDDHDNVVEQATETRQTDMSLDDDGNVVGKERPVPSSRNRLDYQYDATGNWTEKVVSAWIEADGDFRRWSLERRVISYWQV